MDLEKLQSFKIPFARFYEQFVLSCGVLDNTDDDLCEFYLFYEDDNEFIGGEENEIENQIQETAQKLAKLLEVREQQLKDNVINFTK